MPVSSLYRACLTAALAITVGGCDALLAPSETLVDESELTFVRVDANAPPVNQEEVSFWVTPSETRQAEIRYVYEDAAGNVTSTKCLLFRVPIGSVLTHPNGEPVAAGDSVKVTIRLLDKSFFRFEFAPAGLRFDPGNPAQLEVRYRYLSADVNGDGVVDAKDDEVRARFTWWRQERVGEGWQEIPTVRLDDLLEVHAQVTGFTRYALASN